ncbi:hypothetical protein [Brockia lithotrophica]|uniref:Uncharacterized protein n=1 Tax=Brockia lithotrophica TaxID=933949 RepID=A0A660KVU3_9BACL|nr:hypothetical protein [Brockia lithotrophica]RKQ84274.1 hypothetical protein C7438_1454 [Brockia lithotrophica]
MYRLYIVEDDASLRTLLAENLVRYGYTVEASREEDFPVLDRVVREFDPFRNTWTNVTVASCFDEEVLVDHG